MRTVVYIDKQCTECGEMMHHVTSAKQLCKRCLKERINERSNKRSKELKKRKSIEEEAHKSYAKEFAEICRIANAVGMTYGKMSMKAQIAGKTIIEYAREEYERHEKGLLSA